uniref:SH3 and cysteine-rich domain-containing protein 3 n=1 Tax=Anopheles gambiae TaxID=7165 RepID=A0A903XXH7_ANOGA
MYVIFPADELILLTYGIAVPRVPPRPTLDNLREPLVPTGSRPSSTTTTTTTSKNTTTVTTSSTSNTTSSKHPSKSSKSTATKANTPANTKKANDSSKTGPSTAATAATTTTATTSAASNRRQESGESYELDGPCGTTALADASELATFADDAGPRNGIPAAAAAGPLGAGRGGAAATAASPRGGPGKEPAAAGAPKSKSKLQLKLGRLRPHSSIEQSETASRVREDLHIHVSNPVFTRDNLRQRNFDAFFESGEQVYSLEVREKPTPRSLDALGSSGSDPGLAEADGGLRAAAAGGYDQRPSSLGFFRKPKSPLSIRSKSAEHEFADAETSQKESSKSHRHNIFSKRGATPSAGPAFQSLGGSMSTSGGGGVLKDLGHPGLNEALKSHNGVTFKLVKTVSDFSETLAQLYEQHAEALQVLVSNYRKRNSELRKERPACQSNLFAAWETLLQEIEADSQATIDVASTLSRQVARPLLERSFYRKVQSRKVFTHRESFDTIISKTEEKLSKCRIEYKQCYIAHRQSPTQHTLTQYIDSHNAYVQQLHATNAMLEAYHCETLPQLMQELEEIYNDLCNIVSEAVLQGAEAIAAKAAEQAKRYDGLAVQCKNVSPALDLGYFVRTLPVPQNNQRIPRKAFAPPQSANAPTDAGADDYPDYGGDPMMPVFKDELVVDRGATIQVRPSLEALRRESQELEIQIKQLQDSVDALVRTQIRGIEGQLYSKANEIQEDISMKKFDVRAKQIHLAAVRAQKELFLGRIDPGSPRGERKMSSSSSSSMKTKWLKAFRSLKPAGSANDRKSGNGAQIRFDGTDNHNLQEYTYKKITPCDVCSQVLRGHTRQGLRCRICKVNVHADCASQLPKCQVKQKLLRRQKSTSEIENRATEVEEENMRVPTNPNTHQAAAIDSGARRRLFAGFRPMSGFGILRLRSAQHRSISLPETEEDDIMISTRPFGQPLCFVVEEPPPEEMQSGKKDGKRKK